MRILRSAGTAGIAQAKRRERELGRLEQEIETLKERLALTLTTEQVQTVFDLIEKRKARLTELSDAGRSPVGNIDDRRIFLLDQ